jgi:hypothetical protein
MKSRSLSPWHVWDSRTPGRYPLGMVSRWCFMLQPSFGRVSHRLACSVTYWLQGLRRRSWKSKAVLVNRPWSPTSLWEVEAPIFSRQSAHRWRWGCQPYAPASHYPPGIFLVLVSVRGWGNLRDKLWLEWLGKLKKSNGLIGNQSRDLPACSTVPQPTTLPVPPTLVCISCLVHERAVGTGLILCFLSGFHYTHYINTELSAHNAQCCCSKPGQWLTRLCWAVATPKSHFRFIIFKEVSVFRFAKLNF